MTVSKWQLPTIAAIIASVMLAACGGSSGGGQAKADNSPEKQLNSVVFNKSSILTDSVCPAGGVEIETGVDVNGNGKLDQVEITDTYTLCHGSSGNNGLVAMINTSPITAGIECSLGGVSIQSGMDINGNAKLDLSEISTSSSICNYNNGAVDGFNSLVDIADEAAGNNCSSGGQRISTGSDTNRNAILDDDEILLSKYICDGASGSDGVDGSNGADGSDGINGATALVNLVNEAIGENCTKGGMRIDAGLDINSDSVLQEGEVTSQNYICAGENGSLAVNSLVDVTSVEAGEICSNGGQKITSGLDVNNNNALDVEEINRTANVCNGAGDSGAPSNLPRTQYISYATTESLNLVEYPKCIGAQSASSTRTEYFDMDLGTSEPPYAVCLSSYCHVYPDNGFMSLSTATGGDGCHSYHYETHRCNAGYAFNEEKSACVSTTVSCPIGELNTSRGCEPLLAIDTCTGNQVVEDNQCIDVIFTELSGDLCGEYTTSVLVKTGEHLLTCDTNFQELVVFEAGTTVNVDSYWTINAKNLRINGSASSPVVIQPSLNNPYGKWTDLNIESGTASFDLVNGYLSGNRIQYLQVAGANIVNLNNVSIENSTINAKELKLDSGYVLASSIIASKAYPVKNSVVIETGFTLSSYALLDTSFFFRNTMNSNSSITLRSGLFALNSSSMTNLMNTDYHSYYHTDKSAVNTSALFNELTSTGCTNSSFPYYEKNHFSGNHYTGGVLPTATESCVGEQNSLFTISSLYGAYILGREVFTLTVGQSVSPKSYILDSTDLVTDAVVVWKVRYDKDGETFILPESWEGYNPTVTFNTKESYELYIHSINGATDIIGHKVLRVHVQ